MYFSQNQNELGCVERNNENVLGGEVLVKVKCRHVGHVGKERNTRSKADVTATATKQSRHDIMITDTALLT